MHPTLARLTSATRQAARDALRVRSMNPAYPVIQKCPSPTCECAEMPSGLDIERQKPLNGTMAAYSEQLVVLSGQADWTSKVEDEKDTAPWGELIHNVKSILGKGGEYHDPYHSVSINACSFEAPASANTTREARALLFPSFRAIDQIKTERRSVQDFVRTFLLPEKLHSQHDSLSEEDKKHMTRDSGNVNSPEWTGKVRPISAPTIMVCSHHSRDSRCGILGPLLHAEFSQYINKKITLRNLVSEQMSSDRSAGQANARPRTFASHPEFEPDLINQDKAGLQPINVGMISHIGGHKWAGNVIVYIPPGYCCNPLEAASKGPKPKDNAPHPDDKEISEDARADEIVNEQTSPLAGKTIWYGRVEPKHIEGIVEQTIGHGRIIGELFRGGLNADGSHIRI